jgi:hypothetical protein
MTRTLLSVRRATIAVAAALAVGDGISTVTTEPTLNHHVDNKLHHRCRIQ